MQATVQVLLKEGKSQLTTTRIAERAGVSVGTLYQYFPNKGSLLQALLKEHLNTVACAVESACRAAQGASVAAMAEAVTSAFVQAKFRSLETSAALYAVSDDIEGKRIALGMHERIRAAMTAMLRTAQEHIADAEGVTGILLSAMAGVSRGMLEGGVTRGRMAEELRAKMERELTVMVRSYLEASVMQPDTQADQQPEPARSPKPGSQRSDSR